VRMATGAYVSVSRYHHSNDGTAMCQLRITK
jgi:hypothetical protein